VDDNLRLLFTWTLASESYHMNHIGWILCHGYMLQLYTWCVMEADPPEQLATMTLLHSQPTTFTCITCIHRRRQLATCLTHSPEQAIVNSPLCVGFVRVLEGFRICRPNPRVALVAMFAGCLQSSLVDTQEL
jgi:hypothetical protein